MPKATGSAGDGRPKIGGRSSRPPKSNPTLKELGISKDRSSQAQRLATIPKKDVERICKELSEADKPISPSAVVNASKRGLEKRETKPPRKVSNPAASAYDPHEERIMTSLRAIQAALRDIAEEVGKHERADFFAELRKMVDKWEKVAAERGIKALGAGALRGAVKKELPNPAYPTETMSKAA